MDLVKAKFTVEVTVNSEGVSFAAINPKGGRYADTGPFGSVLAAWRVFAVLVEPSLERSAEKLD